jgi:probable phosphoglycerate mutase
MTRVLLIRHGETAWNRDGRWQGHSDVPLSPQGYEQAARLATHLRQESPTVRTIYSSDLQRALETARVVAETLDAELVADAMWREIDVGNWSGLLRADIEKRYADDWRRIAAGEDLPRGGGETFCGFSERIIRALNDLRDRHEGETIAVVTHGGSIRAALLHVLGLPWSRLREVASIGNTAINELAWDGSAWFPGRRNLLTHLLHQAPPMEAP